jgi:Protein of unknown function, DUF488
LTALFTASYRAYRPELGQAVVTSQGFPRWLPEAQEWPRAWVLTPSWDLFHAKDPAAFRTGYLERLDRFGACKIARVLERIARQYQASALVLVCHEQNWEQCHRGLIAEWLLTRTGELVEELAAVHPNREDKS